MLPFFFRYVQEEEEAIFAKERWWGILSGCRQARERTGLAAKIRQGLLVGETTLSRSGGGLALSDGDGGEGECFSGICAHFPQGEIADASERTCFHLGHIRPRTTPE